ncbi:MAG: AcrB/AcrD/AcrF family protein, partial [Gammaproteobacteria bacterium]
MFALAWVSPGDWKRRLVLAVAAGAIVAGWHALMFPHCLQRLEGVSPEVERLWLSHVKEARPVYRHGWRIATLVVALPVTGMLGWAFTMWMRRGDREQLRRVIGAAIPGFVATLLLLWQTRTGPAAQMMAVVGASAVAWFLLPPAWRSKSPVTRVLGGALVVICAAGAIVPMVVGYIPEAKASARDKSIGKANRLCGSMWGLRPIALQPKGRIFTFIDLSPRLITVTHHDAVAGPYHRNGQQIADVMNFWRGSESQAHRIVQKYRSDYVLSCPNSSTTTIFASEAPTG